MKFRMERVDLEIKKALSKIISNLDDFRLKDKFVTISEVKTSPDLYSSKVSISCINESGEEVVKVLNQSKGFIKKELARQIKIKRIPDLFFVSDYVEKDAQRIEELLKQINKTENKD